MQCLRRHAGWVFEAMRLVNDHDRDVEAFQQIDVATCRFERTNEDVREPVLELVQYGTTGA